jgi:glycolate oxidase
VNVFHAGDGNLHPILLFDERNAEQVKRVMLASDEILGKCIELGGSVTGEHGIGVEKISFMNRLFTEEDLAVMEDVRKAFNPQGRCSPGKLLPTAGACGMEHIEKNLPGRQAAM